MVADFVNRIDNFPSLYVLNPSSKIERKDREKQEGQDRKRKKNRESKRDVEEEGHLVDKKA